MLVFVVGLLLCALITKPYVSSWNDASRLAMIDALVTHQTAAIDDSPYAAQTRDTIHFQGRTYSDKPPLLALEGAAVAIELNHAGITLQHDPRTSIYFITLLSVGIWYGIGCVYAYLFQRLLGFDRLQSISVTVLTGTGTLVLPYAAVLTNHVPCGAAFLAGAYHLYRARAEVWHAIPAGMLFGLACLFDASALTFTVFGVFLLRRSSPRCWLLATAAFLPCLALEALYNFTISGSVVPPALNPAFWSDPSLSWQSPPSGWAARLSSYAACALAISIGSKGVVTYTPLVLVCAYGAVQMWRAGGALRELTGAMTSTLVLYVGLIVVLQAVDVSAQNYGERRYANVLPVVAIALGPAFGALPRGWPLVGARLLAVASIVMSWLGVVAPFGGKPGEPGVIFASSAFVRLAQRAPMACVLDLVLLGIMAAAAWLLTRPAQVRLTAGRQPG